VIPSVTAARCCLTRRSSSRCRRRKPRRRGAGAGCRGADRRKSARRSKPASLESSFATITPSSSSIQLRASIPVFRRCAGQFAAQFHVEDPRRDRPGACAPALRQGFDPPSPALRCSTTPWQCPSLHPPSRGQRSLLPIYGQTPTAGRIPPWTLLCFGHSVARAVTGMGLKTVFLAERRHVVFFPATDRYGSPELALDRRCWRASPPQISSLICHSDRSWTPPEYELRAGPAPPARSASAARHRQMYPSWHHDYASLAGSSGIPRRRRRIIPHQAGAVGVDRALHGSPTTREPRCVSRRFRRLRRPLRLAPSQARPSSPCSYPPSSPWARIPRSVPRGDAVHRMRAPRKALTSSGGEDCQGPGIITVFRN